MQLEEKRLCLEQLLIPEELITEILLRLLVKSLMRFKLVSKSFNSLISSPHFVKLHLHRCFLPNANPLIIFCPPDDDVDEIEYLPLKSLLKTPPSTILDELQYLPVNWEGPHIVVGSCNDNNWRHTGCCFPSNLTTLIGDYKGVHLNGTLNWLAILKIYEDNYDFELHKYDFEWDNGSCLITSFDLNKEEFVRLLLPVMPHKFSAPHLGVLGECLCVSVDDGLDNFVIWQMKEFGDDGSWIKLLSINYHQDIKPRGLPFPFGFAKYMFDNGDVLMLPEKYLYNKRDNRLSPLKFINNLYLSSATICCESLISPP
ncbi:F-box/kelch-repeat protein At3g06240-like [Lotus japonicus]|uniref:F-box/kelch-repeat protein At3g06240-like n=1 Tax=Lotus japonicus TaxID=34305 RepID=UPI002587E3D9|nr:F-box/kelch-repeat protein At3g06240-like [Lotus japonicus]